MDGSAVPLEADVSQSNLFIAKTLQRGYPGRFFVPVAFPKRGQPERQLITPLCYGSASEVTTNLVSLDAIGAENTDWPIACYS